MSIKKKITILFLLSLILMLALSFWLRSTNKEKNKQIVVSKYISSSKELLPLIFDSNTKALEKKLKEFHYKSIKELNAKTIFEKSLGVGTITLLENDQAIFLKIHYLDEEYIFFDTTQNIFRQESLITNLFLIFDIALLIVIYFLILKIIAPIKTLSNSMQSFAQGDFTIQMPTKGNDEITLLAKSFNTMAKKLKESFLERENLLRYFGHEIRTPLAKAQYALENKEYEKIQKNLQDIQKFVQEVLNMHLINAKNFHKEHFKASTLVVESLNKCTVIQEEDITLELKKDFIIYGDLHYLSIALKNLIDNALKYSHSLPITITIKKDTISVISKGEELKEGLSYYLKPFHKKSQKGFGLGLSISFLILQEHNFSLIYQYNNKNNIFTISFNS